MKRDVSGFTILESVVAMLLLGIATGAIYSAIAVMRLDNLSGAQRMLAASVAMEIMERFKSRTWEELTMVPPNYTDYLAANTNPSINLKTGSNWAVPTSTGTTALPVDDLDSTKSSTPNNIDSVKLPNGAWAAQVITDQANSTARISVTITWNVTQNSKRTQAKYTLSSIISKNYPRL